MLGVKRERDTVTLLSNRVKEIGFGSSQFHIHFKPLKVDTCGHEASHSVMSHVTPTVFRKLYYYVSFEKTDPT